MRENVKVMAELLGLNLLLEKPQAEEIIIKWMGQGESRIETAQTQTSTV
jgi:hypothetical protein